MERSSRRLQVNTTSHQSRDRCHQSRFPNTPLAYSPMQSTPLSMRSRSRSRSLRLQGRHAQRLMRGETSMEHNACFSSAMLVESDLPPAQLCTTTFLVVDADSEERVGHIWANPRASVNRSIDELGNSLKIATRMEVVPMQAVLWEEVARIHFHGRTLITHGSV